MSKDIEIRMSTKSLDDAIKELKRLEDDFMRKFDIFVRILVNDGVQVARTWISTGAGIERSASVAYQVDSSGDIAVAVIQMTGKDALFIEFGAGAEANPGIYPTKGGEKEDFLPGSYSKDNRGTYQAWERAGYPGLYYYEQKPARGFDTAIGEFHTIVKEVADEVFK